MVSQNIRKFANNLDIVINAEQSKALNGIWTNNIFSNQEKTFFFKLYNNTLGYNMAVAHFVRGHSPNCTFCDMLRIQEQHPENALHLFFDCECVSSIIDLLFQRLTSMATFTVGRREFFTVFERAEFGIAKNRALTLISKFVTKYIWDCRNKRFLPTLL
jgi:hypothetical protein